MTAEVLKAAVISDDGVYRYLLSRVWDPSVWTLAFIMLNPSTADADNDDPTIRRCVGFARSLGYGGITVLNLYAYRATKPADLWRADDPIGPENDKWLQRVLRTRSVVGPVPAIAAWGANAKPERAAALMAMPGAEHLMCLGTTKSGAPRHPLYLPKDAPPVPFGGSPDE